MDEESTKRKVVKIDDLMKISRQNQSKIKLRKNRKNSSEENHDGFQRRQIKFVVQNKRVEANK